MPLYDYECAEHGMFEVFRTMNDNKLQKCPTCQAIAKRVFAPLPAIYKTDGFYYVDSGKRFESQLGPVGKETYRKAKERVGL